VSGSARREPRPPEGTRLLQKRGREQQGEWFGSAGASPSRGDEVAAEVREGEAR